MKRICDLRKRRAISQKPARGAQTRAAARRV
jgi:hypothetical protein